MNLLLSGTSEKDERYNELKQQISNFEIKMKDGTSRKSLQELKGLFNILVFEQNEGIFYSQKIDEDKKAKLQSQLNITFPSLNRIKDIDFQEIVDSYALTLSLYNEQITDEIDYESLNDRGKYFEIDDMHFTYEEKPCVEEFEKLIELLNFEIKKGIYGVSVYSDEERKLLKITSELIKEKSSSWNLNIDNYEVFASSVKMLIRVFNDNQLKSHQFLKANMEIKNKIKENMYSLGLCLKKHNELCLQYEDLLSEKSFMDYKEKEALKSFDNYTLKTSYDVNNGFDSLIEKVFKADCREQTLFASFISTIEKDSKFDRNRELKLSLDKYYSDYFLRNFSTFIYDILVDNQSIMKKSTGEKANILMEIMFFIIEENTSKGIKTILVIDQPEDNLDNKNIDSKIVQKITNMKVNDTLPQIIFVSHNPNITITADSENIIIAKKDTDGFIYTHSGIENST